MAERKYTLTQALEVGAAYQSLKDTVHLFATRGASLRGDGGSRRLSSEERDLATNFFRATALYHALSKEDQRSLALLDPELIQTMQQQDKVLMERYNIF